MVTKAADDLEAVRTVADTLEPFDNDARERIIRWAREKLGMGASSSNPSPAGGGGGGGNFETPSPSPTASEAAPDIKSFVAQKLPKGDNQFAATVAYYYQFKAPQNQRKSAITKEDLVEACRQVVRKQPAAPAQVLVNAYNDGLFDRGAKGTYALNAVGENLVAMTLPGATGSKKRVQTRTARKKAAKKGAKKRVGKKARRSKKR